MLEVFLRIFEHSYAHPPTEGEKRKGRTYFNDASLVNFFVLHFITDNTNGVGLLKVLQQESLQIKIGIQ